MIKPAYLLLYVSLFPVTLEEKGFNYEIFPPLPVAVLETNNSLCQKQSEIYVHQLQNFTLWAFEMHDSSAKSSTGIFRGNRFQMGDFEECLTTEAPFLTKYCLTTLTANIKQNSSHDPLSLYHHYNEHILERLQPYEDVSQQVRNIIQIGWCIPSSCSPQDLKDFLDVYFNKLDLPLTKYNVTYTAQISELGCSTKKDNSEMTLAIIYFCSLTALLLILVIIATIRDFNMTEVEDEKIQKTFLYRYLMCFSARKNFNDLTKKDESNDALSILYGIRTICIMCIIIDHRFGTLTSASLMNFDFVEKQYRAPLAPFIFRGDLLVDSFFIMSGLLVTFGVLSRLDKAKINPGFIILMRYVRLTPVYAFVIFYYATLFDYSGTGPMWKIIVGQESQDCKDNWWTGILYISNYINAENMCMVHSWYLSCDFHFFIIAIAICWLIKKEKNMGLFALLIFIIVSIIIPFVLTLIYERSPLLHFYPDFLTAPKVHPDFRLNYTKSHTRATPYFMGMSIGYIYYRCQGKTIKISKIKTYIIWFVSLLFIVTSMFGGAVFYDPYHRYNVLESASYAALNRPAFALGTIGIMYGASYGNVSFLRKILAWSPWIPLSKLVYSAYLIHMQFQLRYVGSLRNPQYFSYFNIVSLGLSDVVLAFLSALALYLTIEIPFKRIFVELLISKNKTYPLQNKNNSAVSGDLNGTSTSRL